MEIKPLIEAHIIPRGSFKRIETGEPNFILDERNYPRKNRKGLYDPEILCAECDNKIGVWDHYAQAILTMDMSGFAPIFDEKTFGGWDHYDWVYRKLKLFFISMLWRASISKLTEYRKIDIGLMEDIARDMMRADDPGDVQAFSVILARFTEPLGHAFFDPHLQQIEGIDYGRFYFAGYMAYIKADGRPSSFLKKVVLREGQPLRVTKLSIHDTGEDKIVNAIINAPKNASFKRRQSP